MKYLDHNISIIQYSNTPLFNKLTQIQTEEKDLTVSPSASGKITAQIDGKFIHSSRDPVKEAKNITKHHLVPGVTTCVIEGFGLGYYAEEVLLASATVQIIIIDPSLERFKQALAIRDLSALLASQQVTLLIGENAEVLAAILLKTNPGDIAVIRNRTLYMADTEYYKETESYISRYTARKQVNEATLKRFGQIWIRNLIYNMNILPESGALQDLENLFSPIPVLLLAAGPSLTAILPYLEELKEKLVIVAVDTVSEALVQYGITPDFLIVIDPQYWNTRHVDRIDMSKTILVSEASTYPSVFRKNHRIQYLSGSLFPLGQFMETFTGFRKRLGAGGSVSTSAWDFCHLISSAPVYCAGLDLGFPEKETHYKGSFFEERAHIISSRLNPAAQQAFSALHSAQPFPAENNEKGTTLTDQRLIVYKQWFEERIEQSPERTTCNLSPKGVKIKGIPFLPVEELLCFPQKRDTINTLLETLSPPPEAVKNQTTENLLKGVNILIDELEKLSSLTGKSIETINSHLNNPSGLPYKKALSILDSLDREIINMKSKKISGFLIQPLLRDVMKASGVNPLMTSKNLYSEIKKSSDYHLELLKLFVKNYKESSRYTEL